MKILIYSSTFYPNIGGMETMIAALALEFQQQGHQVKLLTPTTLDCTEPEPFTFTVHRKPGIALLWKLSEWCDIMLHNCISLKCGWMYGLFRKKIIVTHQTWYKRLDGSTGWQDRIKLFICRLVTNISISQAIASAIPGRSFMIPNFYRQNIFTVIPAITRKKEIVYLGRLVSDRGVDLLILSIAQLRHRNIYPYVTIVGNGPEEANLRSLVLNLGLQNQIELTGLQTGSDLVNTLNSHQIMVVPSRWDEPFGIVALEGIACGCVVVGSEGGGLKDAIGPCGITFSNGNVDQLTSVLQDLLENPSSIKQYLQHAEAHLIKHTQKKVARAYLEVFYQVRNLSQVLNTNHG